MKYFIVFGLLMFLMSCSSEGSDGLLRGSRAQAEAYAIDGVQLSKAEALNMDDDIEIEPPTTTKAPEPTDYSIDKGSKIIKEGSISLKVDSISSAKSRIDTLVKSLGAYYEQEQFYDQGSSQMYALRIRVPSSQFEDLLVGAEQGIGIVVNKTINAKDVTEQFVDNTIRLQNNEAYLQQYNTLLRKANSIKDILEIQEKNRYLTSEIERQKGRLRYLSDQVQYSTLHLNLETETLSTTQGKGFWQRLTKAFQNGAKLFVDLFVLLISLWPFVLAAICLFAFRKSLFARLKKSNNS